MNTTLSSCLPFQFFITEINPFRFGISNYRLSFVSDFFAIIKMRVRSIFNTIFTSHIAVGVISVLSLALVFYFLLSNVIISRTQNQLSSLNILKKKHIEDYLKRTERELLIHFKKFNSTNPNGLKSELEIIKDEYEFKALAVTNNNNVILMVSSDSAYNHLIRSIVKLKQSIRHFEIIDQSNRNAKLTTQLVYALPLTVDSSKFTLFILDDFSKIQRILKERTGMGSTGESYIVAKDKKMRSESRFFEQKKPLEITVETEATKNVFEGKDSIGLIADYRGVEVISVYRKIESPFLEWAIISEIDVAEAMAPIEHLRNYLIYISVATLVVVTVLTLIISTSISKPILQLTDRIEQLALGIIPTSNNAMPAIKEVRQISTAIEKLIQRYQQTSTFAGQIGSGYFTASFDALSEHDIIGKSLINMRDKLKELSEQQVKLSREKASALLQGQENERKRIVQDLHDGIGQHLTGIRLQVQTLHAGDAKQELLFLIDETIKEVKRVSYDIMPNALVDFGLKAALDGLVENVKKYSRISIDFTYVKEVEQTLPFDISIAVFRIVQEGFNNVLKHADANQIDFYVRKSEAELYFFIKDNGKGFDPKLRANTGMGLQSMTERTKLLNGSIEINATLGAGSSIEVTIPIDLSTKAT